MPPLHRRVQKMYWFSEERLSVNLDFLESFLVVPFIKSITYQRGQTVRELSLLDFGTLRHILEYKFWFLKRTMIPCVLHFRKC